MNCTKCNVVLVYGSSHCTACGEPAAQESIDTQNTSEETNIQEADTQEVNKEATQEPSSQNETAMQNAPQGNPKPDTKPNIPWKIIAPIAAVLLIGIIAISSVFTSGPVVTALSINAAFENLGSEMAERVENSPFVAFLMLEDILEDGSLTVDFVHSSGQGGFGMFDTRGSVTMLSHYETDESAFLIDVRVGGFINVDLDIYLNTERLAARSNMLGNIFYGITFDTFRNDIHAFGPLIGLDNATMDELADFVEVFSESLDNPMFTNSEEFIEPYMELLLSFAANLERSSDGATVAVGSQNIDVTRITFTITERDLANFLADLHTMLENDDALRSYIGLQASLQDFNGASASIYDEFLVEFQEIIDELEQMISGSIIVELNISSENRLMSSTKVVDIEVDGTPIELTAIMDLGASIRDPWTLDIYTEDGTFGMLWTFQELYGMFENRLAFGTDNDTIASLASEWFPETGEFTLFYGYYGTSPEDGSISGLLGLDDEGGFNLTFSDSIDLGDGQSLSIGISGALGANIGQIEFINLDQWDADLVDMIFDLLNFF